MHVLIISQNISDGYVGVVGRGECVHVAECVGYLCRQRGAVCGVYCPHLCVYVGEAMGVRSILAFGQRRYGPTDGLGARARPPHTHYFVLP